MADPTPLDHSSVAPQTGGSEEDEISGLGIAAWSWDIADHTVRWSQAACELYGRPLNIRHSTLEEFVGRAHSDDRAALMAFLYAARVGNRARHEHRFRAPWPDGSVHLVLSRMRLHIDSTRQRSRLEGVDIDLGPAAESREQNIGEVALRGSEQLLALALQASLMGVWDWNLVTGDLRWQGQTLSIFGLETFDNSLEAFTRHVHRDDVDRVLRTLFDAMLNHSRYQCEYRIIRPNGEIRWVADQGQPFYNEAGAAVRMLGTMTDITARKAAEQALALSEERLRLASDAAGLGVYDIDVASGLSNWSSGIWRLTGLTGENPVPRQQVVAAIHPDDRTNAEALVQNVIQRLGSYEQEFRLKRPDGEVVWVLDRGEALGPIDEATGHVSRLAGTLIDLTSHKQVEAALRESEWRLQLALQASRSRVYDWNLVTGKVMRQGEGLRIFEIEQSDSSPNSFAERLHPQDSERVLGQVRTCLEKHARFDCEYRIVRSDGEIRWVADQAQPFYDENGTPARLVGTITDITERKRHEEHIGFLLQEMNHRTKNILSVVLAVAHQTLAGNDSEGFVQRLGDRLNGLAASHELLVRNSWQGADLKDVVASQLSHFHDLIGDRITIEGPPLQVSAAAAQSLGMALHELSTNAGKYGALASEHGSIRISWSIAPEGAAAVFRMRWQETCPSPILPPVRKGFGTRVTTSMVEMAFGGHVDLAYAKFGLNWQLVAPANSILEGQKT